MDKIDELKKKICYGCKGGCIVEGFACQYYKQKKETERLIDEAVKITKAENEKVISVKEIESEIRAQFQNEPKTLGKILAIITLVKIFDKYNTEGK